MANRVPECGSIGSLHEDRRKAEPWNFNAANQAVGRGRP
jgi:hypothetical protein